MKLNVEENENGRKQVGAATEKAHIQAQPPPLIHAEEQASSSMQGNDYIICL